MASYGDLLVTSLVVLVGVCIAAFVVVRAFGRFLATGRTRGAHLLDVVARVPLEPRRSLYVVEVAGKTLLVGTSEMGLNVLSELDAAEVRSRVVERPTFAEMVKQAWAKRKGLSRGATSHVGSDDKPSHVGLDDKVPASHVRRDDKREVDKREDDKREADKRDAHKRDADKGEADRSTDEREADKRDDDKPASHVGPNETTSHVRSDRTRGEPDKRGGGDGGGT